MEKKRKKSLSERRDKFRVNLMKIETRQWMNKKRQKNALEWIEEIKKYFDRIS